MVSLFGSRAPRKKASTPRAQSVKRARIVKIFMRRDCSIEVIRRGVLGSGFQIADRLKWIRGGEEQNVVLTLVVCLAVVMHDELG